MQSMSQYTDVLTQAMSDIECERISAAEWLLNNYYHRQKRTGAEYSLLLWLTLHHREFITATKEAQHELARILFLLDTKHHKNAHPAHVTFRKEHVDGVEQVVFTLQERESTPAH